MIGWFMNESPRGASVPAQRVVSAKGELSGSWAFGQRGRMRELLERDGITFSDAGTIDMKRYGWDPRQDLTSDELETLLQGVDSSQVEVSDHLLHLLRDDPASPFRVARAE